MTDGLECCEVLLSHTLKDTDYFRLEPEYYNAGTFSFPHILKGADVQSDIQYGTSKVCDENNKDGYPVLRLNELNNGFIEKPRKYCRLLSKTEFESLRLKKDDILIIRTNGNSDLVGRAAVVMEDTGYAFASYLFRVIPNGTVDSCCIAAFLNSRYGRMEIDKNSMKSNQTNFSPAKFRDISIPVFGATLQKGVRYCFEMAYKLRTGAENKYKAAESDLLTAVNFHPFKCDKNFVAKSFSESFRATGRLDAEYYQPKYDNFFALLKELTVKPLGELVCIRKSIEPGSKFYSSEGVPFIRVSDISERGIGTPAVRIPEAIIPSIETLYLKKDTILLSKDGSVGIACKVDKDTKAVTSGALLHLRVKNQQEILPDYLMLVLNSDIVRMQAERDTNGAILQHWRIPDIKKAIIPVLSCAVQREIANKVQESFSLRRSAGQLMDTAVKSVEISIEKGEDSALKYLSEHTKPSDTL